MAIIIPVDATPYVVDKETNPEQFGPDGMTLEVMQALVGGYIEHVYMHPVPKVLLQAVADKLRLSVHADLDGGVAYPHLVLNEEGKLLNLPVNPTATAIARQHGLPHDVIVGTVILLIDEEFQ